jgi:hypothetical protein
MIRRVSNEFEMPAFHTLEGGIIHAARVRDLHIFDEQIYFFEVLEPSLAGLGLTKRDLKQRQSKREQGRQANNRTLGQMLYYRRWWTITSNSAPKSPDWELS